MKNLELFDTVIEYILLKISATNTKHLQMNGIDDYSGKFLENFQGSENSL